MDNLVADGKLIASQVIVNRGRTNINTINFFILDFLSFVWFTYTVRLSFSQNVTPIPQVVLDRLAFRGNNRESGWHRGVLRQGN